jgi:hypothetical protein
MRARVRWLDMPNACALTVISPMPYINKQSGERGVDHLRVWCSRQDDRSEQSDPAHQRGPMRPTD